MKKRETINIELKYKDRTFDLKIPSEVSKKRLKELLAENLKQLNVALKKDWKLNLIGKNVKLSDDITLDKYPISDGDRFIIEE
ncbi:EsaB/YukD family protein [Companilactobacillus sp. DQM5]|uniref:EsaB/YukD family protein n=1 Tax=Companilactobacillus sp. DQM5 TaxID=3463359 RepID=UPI0040583EDC